MMRIKELRQKRNLSLRDLASELNIAYSSLGKYERGDQQPSFDTLIKIADYFNVTTDYLIGRSDGKTTDLKKLYEKIGLSEDSISLLEFMAKGEKEHSNPVLLKMNPIKSIDFCLSQGQLSFDLFDCIHAYFIANVPDDKQLYVSDTGEVLLSPTFSGKDTLYQTIPASYLRDAILQEISNNLKELKKIYDQENSI